MYHSSKKFYIKQPGFTLIELLVVIAIISLLSSVVLASLSGAREQARITRTLSDYNQIELALNLWMDAEGYTEWPHPDDDLGINLHNCDYDGSLTTGPSSGYNYHTAPIECLAEETSFGDYINAVPDAQYGDEIYLYFTAGASGNCGNAGVLIRVYQTEEEIGADLREAYGVETDNDDCGKIRYRSNFMDALGYVLSTDSSF